MRDATLVTTQSQLDAAVFRLQSASRLAIDTEFMRERTYFPQLCLLQVAADADCFLVDPLAGLDLGALHALLADRSKLKILHAARQDLEVLQLGGRAVPAPVFDTQVAAAMLGFPPQAGYAELVARQLGHSIDKGQTRTDWSRRPLTPEQLAYAADDVHHLLALHSELAAALTARGRAAWVAEDAAALEDPGLYRTEPADAWRRLKGLGRLKPREQAAARALAEWREARAIEADKPRGWILADDALYAIATALPRTASELGSIASLPPATVRKRGDELLALIAAALEAPPAPGGAAASGKPTPQENALVARLQQLVRDEATALGVSPEVIATRRDVEALVFKDRGESAVLRGWRREVIGDKLLAALEK
ncbi:MAG: ribonuclease D [Steroidobacteraceae bacterium]